MTNSFFNSVNRFGSRAKAFANDHKPNATEIDQAKRWARKTVTEATKTATLVGTEAMKSEFVKDVVKTALLGAVIAVPVPIIGPVSGACIGAMVGAYANLTRPRSA